MKDIVFEDTLRLAGVEDIAAMKLAAITNRGTKKDFIDLYFLLKQYGLEELLDFYKNKYHDGSIFLVIKSLSYFDDAEEEAMPDMCVAIKWKDVKDHISHILTGYLKNNK